jgi:hypothetical protein
MLRTLALRPVIGSALLLASFALAATDGPLTVFPSEEQAQQHCPRETVVWLNLPTHIYHFKGMRWYGQTRNGAYVCDKEADKAGNRATINGQ